MNTKKPLTPSEFKAAAENYFRNQAAFQKGQTPEELAAHRLEGWTAGYNHLQDIAKTLREIAISHPDAEKRKQANLAINKLDNACVAFGEASLNQGHVFGKGVPNPKEIPHNIKVA